jgi:distribution and morphology protein 31
VDAVIDIMFPRDPSADPSIPEILGEIAESISTNLAGEVDPKLERIPGQRVLARPALTAPEDELSGGEVANDEESDAQGSLKVIVDVDVRFRDLKAAVPIFTNDLSYVNNALVRPIVAFMKYVPPGLLSIFCL